jgi:hypothetical protein
MHPLKDRAVRNALRDWVDIEAWQAPFAVTLTLRQSINVEENSAIRRLWLTDQLPPFHEHAESSNIWKDRDPLWSRGKCAAGARRR